MKKYGKHGRPMESQEARQDMKELEGATVHIKPHGEVRGTRTQNMGTMMPMPHGSAKAAYPKSPAHHAVTTGPKPRAHPGKTRGQ